MEHEKAILGHILSADPQEVFSRIVEVKEIVTHPLMYSDSRYQLLSLCIDDMANADMAIDIYSLDDCLQKISYIQAADKLKSFMGKSEYYLTNLNEEECEDMAASVSAHIGGVQTLIDISQTFIAKSSVKKTCQGIADRYFNKRAVSLMSSYSGKIQKAGMDQNEVIADLIEKLGNIQNPSLKTHNIANVAQEHKTMDVVTEYQDAFWGIDQIDEALPLRRGSFTILAGCPASGKTSLGAQVAYATALKKGPRSVLFVTLEMDRHEITNLIMAQELGIDVKMVERKIITERDRYEELLIDLQENKGIEILDKEDSTWEDVQHAAKIVEARGQGVALIVVDHIHIMESSNKKFSEYERVSEISRALKRIAKRTGAAVLGLCQYNRGNRKGEHDKDGNSKPDKEPMMSDLRGSGSLEQDANAVAMIWNHDREGRVQNKSLCIVKNRKGACMNISLTFQAAAGQRFVKGQD